MGKFDGKYLRGAIGPVTFRKYRGLQVVQAQQKAEKMLQTKKTKQAASVFGKASRLACKIRIAIDPIIGYHDGSMVARFTGELNQVCQALPNTDQRLDFTEAGFERLNGFEFNQQSLVRDHLFVQPTVSMVDEVIQVDFPTFNLHKGLRFVENGNHCILALQLALFDLQHGYYHNRQIQMAEFKYEHQPTSVPANSFRFQGSPGCLCMIGIALRYYKKTFAGNAVLNNKNFNPAALLKAWISDGSPSMDPALVWREFDLKN